MPILPRPPERLPSPRPTDVAHLPKRSLWWRIYWSGGQHPTRWNQFRAYGPLNQRFDHHLEEAPSLQARRILYATSEVPATFAEVYQDDRTIDVSRDDPRLTGFELGTPLLVLDLRASWITRAGASQAISTGNRRIAREWSRAIYEQFPHIQGLVYRSRMFGPADSIALFERAEVGVPRTYRFDRALRDLALREVVERSASEIGYAVIGY